MSHTPTLLLSSPPDVHLPLENGSKALYKPFAYWIHMEHPQFFMGWVTKPLAYWYQTQAPTLHTLQNHHAFCLKHTAFSSSVNVTTGLEEELFMTFSRWCSTFMGEVYGGVHIYILHISNILYIYIKYVIIIFFTVYHICFYIYISYKTL